MFSRSLAITCLGVVLASTFGAGCRPGGPAVDTVPFEHAVNAYLRSQSMDLEAGRFRALQVTGDRASGTVSLVHAEGAAGVSVQWEFDFARQNGAWVVSACRRR